MLEPVHLPISTPSALHVMESRNKGQGEAFGHFQRLLVSLLQLIKKKYATHVALTSWTSPVINLYPR